MWSYVHACLSVLQMPCGLGRCSSIRAALSTRRRVALLSERRCCKMSMHACLLHASELTHMSSFTYAFICCQHAKLYIRVCSVSKWLCQRHALSIRLQMSYKQRIQIVSFTIEYITFHTQTICIF